MSKYYAIYKDKVYFNWEDCKKNTYKKKYIKFKSFKTLDEADYFVKHGEPIPIIEKEKNKDWLKIFTDGSCLNGTHAGIGVHFPDRSTWDVSEPFLLENPTNQRAEIWAIVRAVQLLIQHQIDFDTKILIFTDSKYCEQAFKKWIKNWLKNDWKTVNGQDVKNQDLFKEFWRILNFYPNIIIQHVNAHCGIEGNEIADKLAVKGAKSIKNKPLFF